MKGNQPQVIAIIPARYGSTRLPGKPLLDLAGKPIIQHVYERTAQARNIDAVIIATDDERIAAAVAQFGGNYVMTSTTHETGTDRIAEVARNQTAEIIVNVQGDEPLINPDTIERAVAPLLDDRELMMSTICEPLAEAADLFNPNIVKVVLNSSGDALYFSRAPIPFPRAAALGATAPPISELIAGISPQLLTDYHKHVGLYVYRRDFILQFTTWPRTVLEQIESLEQLRVLEHGYRIRVVPVAERSVGVDTPADLARARRVLAGEE